MRTRETTVSGLRRALAEKPRNQAYVYISAALHAELAAAGEPLLPDLRGPGVHLALQADPSRGLHWVVHVIYDAGYETPEEFGDSDSGDESVAGFPEHLIVNG